MRDCPKPVWGSFLFSDSGRTPAQLAVTFDKGRGLSIISLQIFRLGSV